MHRRTFLASAAAAPVTLAATPIFAEGHAGAALGAAQRFTVGDATVTALSDGYLQLSAEDLPDVTEEQLRDALEAAYHDPSAYLAAVNAYLIQTGDRTVLVDAGTGGAFGPTLGQLPASLAAAGLDPADVDTLMVTHLHPDHIGGAFTEAGAVFPNAEFVLSDAERAFWTDDAIMERAGPDSAAFFNAARAALAAYGERVRGFGGESGFTAMDLPGHTPGHTGLVFASGADSLLIWGDIVHVPPIQFARPEVTIVFDTDPAQAVASRAQVMDMAATDRMMVAGMHLTFPGVGYVERSGDSYAFVPAPYDYG